jgi:hypothetical protein
LVSIGLVSTMSMPTASARSSSGCSAAVSTMMIDVGGRSFRSASAMS